MKARIESAKTRGRAVKQSFDGMEQMGAAGLELFAGLGQSLARIVAKDGGREVGGAALALAELAAQSRLGAIDKVVEALGLTVNLG